MDVKLMMMMMMMTSDVWGLKLYSALLVVSKTVEVECDFSRTQNKKFLFLYVAFII